MGQGEFRLNLMCNLLTEIVQRAQKRAFCKVTRLTFCRCVAVLCSKSVLDSAWPLRCKSLLSYFRLLSC